MSSVNRLNISVGQLFFTEQGDFSALYIECQGVVIGTVMGRRVKITSKISKSSSGQLITLWIMSASSTESSNFSINADDFQLLAKHLPDNHIDDRLNILGDQKKGASDATDQVTTEAILLNDITTITG
jgi:hypothetical protein